MVYAIKRLFEVYEEHRGTVVVESLLKYLLSPLINFFDMKLCSFSFYKAFLSWVQHSLFFLINPIQYHLFKYLYNQRVNLYSSALI